MDYTLYVIPGSHACRAAMLMLKHKRQPYRRVDIPTLLHPVAVRLLGFDAGGEKRSISGRRTAAIRMGDRYGTVPALAAGDRRVSTNRQIARFLDEQHPERPLFPADPARRRAVEEAESWANGPLQMAARRVPLAWAVRDPDTMAETTADGRLGYLLYKTPALRRLIIPEIGRRIFAAAGEADREVMAELPAMLDKVDAMIAGGVIGGDEPNAADLMIAPSLALMLYRPGVRSMFEGRPALALVDRLLPEPTR